MLTDNWACFLLYNNAVHKYIFHGIGTQDYYLLSLICYYNVHMEMIIVEGVRFTDACNKVIKDVHNTQFK